MTRTSGTCLNCRDKFSIDSKYIAYGGAMFCSMDCLTEWAYEYKNSEPGIAQVEEEYEVRNPNADTCASEDSDPETKSSSEFSTESRRAGYRLEAEFECFEIDEYLWLDATPIADAGEVKFRSDRCPECGAIHWTGCAL